MKNLPDLASIHVPVAPPDEEYIASALGQRVSFRGLKQLLGAADYSKAGDRHAGLAAPTESVREMARSILSDLSLQHIYDHPLTDDDGHVDSVMRVNYKVDHAVFSSIAAMTVGELKNQLLRMPGADVMRIGRGLTGVMAAAVAKLCDVHELIFIARKISCLTRARTVLG